MKNKIISTIFTFMFCILGKSFCQVTFNGNNISSTAQFVGSNTAVDVAFKAGTGPTQFGILLNSSGFWGFGPNYTPNYRMDVDAGDINLNSFTNAYRIGDGSTGNSFPVLWHNGQIENIFVGVQAGNTNATTANTFIGYKAGASSGNTSSNPGEGIHKPISYTPTRSLRDDNAEVVLLNE